MGIFTNPAVTNTVVAVSAVKGTLNKVDIDNTGSQYIFVQFFDAVPANVTLGVTVPIFTIGIPPTNGLIDDSFVNSNPIFKTAISIACTTTPNGSTAPSTAANVNIFYGAFRN